MIQWGGGTKKKKKNQYGTKVCVVIVSQSEVRFSHRLGNKVSRIIYLALLIMTALMLEELYCKHFAIILKLRNTTLQMVHGCRYDPQRYITITAMST